MYEQKRDRIPPMFTPPRLSSQFPCAPNFPLAILWSHSHSFREAHVDGFSHISSSSASFDSRSSLALCSQPLQELIHRRGPYMGPQCKLHCFTQLFLPQIPIMLLDLALKADYPDLSKVPTCSLDLKEVNKAKVASLPPHRPIWKSTLTPSWKLASSIRIQDSPPFISFCLNC